MHTIAAKAVAFARGTCSPNGMTTRSGLSKTPQCSVKRVKQRGWRIVSGGTDNHLFLIDLGADFISGKKAERWLGLADITLNKNTVPFDTRKPYIASGLRIGTPAVTTRGMGPAEMKKIAELIDRVLRADEDKEDEAKMAALHGRDGGSQSGGPRTHVEVPAVLRSNPSPCPSPSPVPGHARSCGLTTQRATPFREVFVSTECPDASESALPVRGPSDDICARVIYSQPSLRCSQNASETAASDSTRTPRQLRSFATEEWQAFAGRQIRNRRNILQ